MSGGLGSIPRSKDGMGDSSRNDRGVGGGMVGLGDGCGVDGEGSGVGTTRGVATSGQEGHPAGAVLVLGPSIVLGSAGIAASSFGALGMGGCTWSRRCTAVSISVMTLCSSVLTR